MREIKFRAWDIQNKFMYEEHSVSLSIGGSMAVLDVTGDWMECTKNDIELMQFIGLHDKNGKEIYEGDIVSYKKFHAYADGGVTQEPFIVTWLNGGFQRSDILRQGKGMAVEVIGNIHENPELLK